MHPKIEKARARLMMDQAFFGTLLLGMPLIEDATLKPPTMATDGKSIWFHPAFVDECSVDEVKGVLCHEVLHTAMLHPFRRGGRDRKKANKAMDYAINGIIEDSGLRLPSFRLRDKAYDGKSFEEIYNLMPTEPDEGGSDPGDEAMDEVREGSSDPNEQRQNEAEAKVRVVQAANIGKARGQLPSSLAKLIAEMLEPVVDWKAELRRYCTAVIKNDQSWNKGQRRFLADGLYLPAMHTPSLGVMAVGIDTSGSIVASAPEFLAEVQAIAEDCMPENITVIQCDSTVTAVDVYAPGDKLKAEIKGGGGTDLRKIFDKVAEGDTPSVLVILTDGDTPYPAVPPDYPVVWCVVGSTVPPWGEYIKLYNSTVT